MQTKRKRYGVILLIAGNIVKIGTIIRDKWLFIMIKVNIAVRYNRFECVYSNNRGLKHMK